MLARLALAAAFVLLASMARAEPSLTFEPVGLDTRAHAILADGDGAIALTDVGPVAIEACEGGWCLDLAEPPTKPALPTVDGLAPLPEGLSAQAGSGDVERAWYAGPTTRYAHGVLGDAIEGSALVAETGGKVPTLVLPPNEVFEDIVPRLADLDGDGRTEIVTLLSSAEGGGSLALHALRDGALRTIARTPPIGRPNRWLNVVAIEDFDGDGVHDVVVAETPHIGGELQLWSGASLLAGAPATLARERGYSNHAIGSRALDLAETVTIDDAPALVVPTADRRALAVVAYRGGAWMRLATLDLPARVLSGVAAVGPDLLVGLEDGSLGRVVLSE